MTKFLFWAAWIGVWCAAMPVQMTVNQRGSECLYEQLEEGYVDVFFC
jgi:hypothetical protein